MGFPFSPPAKSYSEVHQGTVMVLAKERAGSAPIATATLYGSPREKYLFIMVRPSLPALMCRPSDCLPKSMHRYVPRLTQPPSGSRLMTQCPVPKYLPPSFSWCFGAGNLYRSTLLPLSTFSKILPSLTFRGGTKAICLSLSRQALTQLNMSV